MVKFELRNEHIALLRGAYVGWDDCEFGAPEINCKRPYGNSDPYPDMMRLLGCKAEGKVTILGKEYQLDVEDTDAWELPDSLSDALRKLHKETETALQIILRTGSFVPGVYVSERYGEWRLKA